jgi:hypothetical protein
VNKVVQNFDMGNIQEMMLLIDFSMGFENETSCFFLDILLTELEERSMLDSEHALNLWASALCLRNNLRNVVIQPKVWQLCTDALKRMDEHKLPCFALNESCMEDRQKIQDLHDSNLNLNFIVSELINWYYDEDDLTRVQHLITAARPIHSMYASEPFLIPLFSKMDEFQHIFEAFHLFSQVHYCMEHYSYKHEDPEVQSFYDEIKAKSSAPIG